MFVALLLALLLPFPAVAVVTAWFQFGAFVALAVGTGVYRLTLVLTPVRPQTRFDKSVNTDPQQQKVTPPQVLRSGMTGPKSLKLMMSFWRGLVRNTLSSSIDLKLRGD